MERSVLDTIQSLALDVQLGIVLLLFALDGMATLGRRVARWRAAQPRRVRPRSVAGRASAVSEVEAWAPESLAANGGHAA